MITWSKSLPMQDFQFQRTNFKFFKDFFSIASNPQDSLRRCSVFFANF